MQVPSYISVMSALAFLMLGLEYTRSVAADKMVRQGARSSAVVVLITWDKWVLGFQENVMDFNYLWHWNGNVIIFDEIFMTGCTRSCQNDNFQCSQWWKFNQNGNISISVDEKYLCSAMIKKYIYILVSI